MNTTLREARDKKGLTALALADAADTNEMRVYAIERGRTLPKLGEAQRMAAVLGVPASKLFPRLVDSLREKA